MHVACLVVECIGTTRTPTPTILRHYGEYIHQTLTGCLRNSNSMQLTSPPTIQALSALSSSHPTCACVCQLVQTQTYIPHIFSNAPHPVPKQALLGTSFIRALNNYPIPSIDSYHGDPMHLPMLTQAHPPLSAVPITMSRVAAHHLAQTHRPQRLSNETPTAAAVPVVPGPPRYTEWGDGRWTRAGASKTSTRATTPRPVSERGTLKEAGLSRWYFLSRPMRFPLRYEKSRTAAA